MILRRMTVFLLMLLLVAMAMFFPLFFMIGSALKPLDELLRIPPPIWPSHPTLDNFSDLFVTMGKSFVPFSRYLMNTIFITVVGTFGHLVVAGMAAFVLAGIGAAGFSISQKARIREMDIVEMNESMFIFGWLTTLLVLIPTAPHATGAVNISGTISMLLLGIITCVGFLLQAAGIRTVPLLIATIIQSSSTVLTILWGVLFYHDPISRYVVLGTVFFMTGIVLVNLPAMKSRHNEQTDE